VSRKGERFLRRLAERRAKIEHREAKLAERMARQDPRIVEDRRQVERRSEALSGQALDDRLRELGIDDRRRGDRRSGGDRRRR
jgi:hypothetical protein